VLGGVAVEFRIGDRDPVTGLYYVIYPDGSQILNGVKIFNAAHQVGDVVRATQRSDGMMVLDGAKAIESSAQLPTLNSQLPTLNSQLSIPGYLKGQVFNNDEEELPILSIDFVAGSPTALPRNHGNFTIAVSVNKPQRRDTLFRLNLSGSAVLNGDYSISVDPPQADPLQLTIPAGQTSKEIVFTPIGEPIDSVDASVIASVGLISQGKISFAKSTVTLNIKRTRFTYSIWTASSAFYPVGYLSFISNTPFDNWAVSEVTADLTSGNLANYVAAWTAAVQGTPSWVGENVTANGGNTYYTTAPGYSFAFLPSGVIASYVSYPPSPYVHFASRVVNGPFQGGDAYRGYEVVYRLDRESFV
jgi:hypothetical protein